MGTIDFMKLLPTLDARRDEPDEAPVISSSSVIPAIDDFMSRFAGRDVVSAGDVVDMLLDLRLIAVADDIVTGRGR